MKQEADDSFDSYIDGECNLEYEVLESEPQFRKDRIRNLTIHRGGSLSPIKECASA